MAVEALNVTAHYEPGRGWAASIRWRRGDETWQEASYEDYSCLASDELVCVLDASVAHALLGPE